MRSILPPASRVKIVAPAIGAPLNTPSHSRWMRSSVAVSWTKTMLSYMPRVASKKRRMAAAPAMALLRADVSSSTCSVNALANASAVARPMISTQPLPGVALGVDMGSAQRDGAEIERHQQGLRHFVSGAVVGVDAAPGRHHDALHVAVVADVVGAGGPAEDVDRVIVAPHQAVRPEVRDLGPRVAGDVRREAHLQAAPRLAVLLPRRDLLAGEAGCGVQEGRGQIGPQRLAGEVGDMEGVPRRFQCLAGEGAGRLVARVEHVAVERFARQPPRHEHAALLRRAERRDADALVVGVDFDDLVGQHAGLLLQMPDGAAYRHLGAQLVVAIPALKAAVGLECEGEQIVHDGPFVVGRATARLRETAPGSTSNGDGSLC